MSDKFGINLAEFANLLQTGIEIPLRPGTETAIHEIAEQVERTTILAVQAHIVIGSTQEGACVSAHRMLQEYMQDPKRSAYAETLFESLDGFVGEVWEVHVNSLKSTGEFPIMLSATQN